MAPEVLNLYVDGASRGNQHTMEERSTGWGFLAVLGPEGEGGSGTIIAEDSGTVVTDPNQVGYWGADVESNNTAELTAFIQALRWALMEGAIPTSSSAPTQPMRATWQQGHGAPKPTSRSSAD